jgi:hypothetical protein
MKLPKALCDTCAAVECEGRKKLPRPTKCPWQVENTGATGRHEMKRNVMDAPDIGEEK